jgi:signal transduction histidine kinase
VSHDTIVQTPRSSLKRATLLRLGWSDGTSTRDVQEIRYAADRAAALTRRLLSFSRRQVLQPAPIAINDVVLGTEALLGRLTRVVHGIVEQSGGTIAVESTIGVGSEFFRILLASFRRDSGAALHEPRAADALVTAVEPAISPSRPPA